MCGDCCWGAGRGCGYYLADFVCACLYVVVFCVVCAVLGGKVFKNICGTLKHDSLVYVLLFDVLW